MGKQRSWWRTARFGAAAGAAAVAALWTGAVAFACTDVMGQLTLSPTQGPAGSTVMTSVVGLKVAPAKYAMHFTVSTSGSADCMSFSGVVTLKTIKTSRSGGWTNVPVTIPNNAALGTHGLCGMEVYPVKGQTGTTHGQFTVV